ncbi:hypothetical protein [Azospirillum sp. TSO22-1]|uniref:hypothetical protein n=1 Tax=Azospirillum sp. TSO22-1 TaxID=716789 RepID=UPI000D62125E|nr:hypothetical protein [Azospirillum sp. TSO22-1]PWC43912.1 hypothetical protein TSO221_18710 [Azospirillum sp. TSO22-1]
MNAISQASMIRGADGRLYAVNARGVTAVAEPGNAVRSSLRIGDKAAFDTADHEASRDFVSPGM